MYVQCILVCVHLMCVYAYVCVMCGVCVCVCFTMETRKHHLKLELQVVVNSLIWML